MGIAMTRDVDLTGDRSSDSDVRAPHHTFAYSIGLDESPPGDSPPLPGLFSPPSHHRIY
jgi:hypothetical protein